MIAGYREIGPTIGRRAGAVSAEAFFRQLSALRASTVVPLDAYDPENPRHVALVLFGFGGRALARAASLVAEFGFPFGLCLTYAEAEALARGGLEAPDLPTSCGCPPGSVVDILIADDTEDRGEAGAAVPEIFLRRFGPRHGRWLVVRERGKSVAFRREPGADEGAAPHGARHPIRMMREGDSLFRGSVAAIITNYNYGPLLREAVDSIDRQLVQPDEFIIVDDASTDGSATVLDELEAAGKTVIRQPANLGIVENFRFCVAHTSSDYLFFLGADNRVRSDFILECRLALDADPAVDVAYTDTLLFGVLAGELARKVGAERIGHAPASNWDIYHWRFPDPTPEALAAFKTSNFVHGSSMYRRSAYERVGGYRKGDQPEDHNLFHRIWSSGGGLAHVAEPLLEYRQHSVAQANNLSALQIENRGLRAQLRAAQIRLSEVEDGYRRQEREVARVNAAFADLDTEYRCVAVAFSEQVARLVANDDALTAQAAEIARINIAFEQQNAELVRVGLAYGDQLATLDACNREIAARDAEIARVNGAFSEQNAELVRVGLAYGDQLATLDACNREIAARDAGIARVNGAFSEQNAELIRVNLAYGDQLATLDACNREIAARDAEIARVNGAFSEQNAELVRVNLAYGDQLATLDGRNREIAARDAEVARVNGAFERQDAEIRRINLAYGEQAAELARVRSALGAAAAETARSNAAVTERDAALASVREARDQATGETERLMRLCAELRSEIQERGSSLEAARRRSLAERQRVHAILDDLETWPRRRSGYWLFPISRRVERLRLLIHDALEEHAVEDRSP